MNNATHAIQLRPATKRILRATLLASVIVIPLLVLLPETHAQSQYLAADSLAISPIHLLAFSGEQCAYAELQANGASAVAPSSQDLRLANCQGKSAFSLVNDQDTTEKGFPVGSANTAPAVRAAYADVNANAAYDQGDHLYLTTGSGQSLAPTSSASSFTLRLTGTSNRAAGTWAYAGETDVVSYQSAAPSIAASWAWTDADGNGFLSNNDGVYVLPGYGQGVSAGSALPSSAVALRVPVAPTSTPSPSPGQPVTGAASLPVSPLIHLASGSSSATDDCAYAELHQDYDEQGAPAPIGPHPFDLRLVACGAHNRWTLVQNADSGETNAGSGRSAPSVRLAYADVNANGVYDGDDGLYLTTGVNNQMPATSSATSFTIRIRSPDTNPGGAWARPGDSDIVSYGSAAPSLAGSWAWVDEDKTGQLSDGDEVYLFPTTSPGYAAGSPLPSNAILVHAVAQSHADCYDPAHGFYDCNNPPAGATPTPTPSGPPGTTEPTATATPTGPTPTDDANETVAPYALPPVGALGTIAAATVAAGSATAFFRRRH